MEHKKLLKKHLKNEHLYFTTDTWSYIQNYNYMCLTTHWIDQDWKLQKRILNVCQVPNHKGSTIGRVIESCLLDWGIEHVLTITINNVSSNDLSIACLKDRFPWRCRVLNNEFLHVHCSTHILNLVEDGLKENNESIIKIRNAVRYVRSSLARLDAFKKCVEHVKISYKRILCLDVETRWNSTYLMLDAIVKFEATFVKLQYHDAKYKKHFEKEKIKGPPEKEDWNRVRVFVKFLKMFYYVTFKFSGSLHVTSNIVFKELVSMERTLQKMANVGDKVMAAYACKMKENVSKYWESFSNVNYLLHVAIVLDPRYKLKYEKFCFE